MQTFKAQNLKMCFNEHWSQLLKEPWLHVYPCQAARPATHTQERARQAITYPSQGQQSNKAGRMRVSTGSVLVRGGAAW